MAGHVITNSGDTLKGNILEQSEANASKKCVILVENGDLKTYLPFEIAEYKYIDNRYYVSKEILIDNIKTPVFLRYLVKGAVELYYFPNNKKSNDIYYIEKDGELKELVNNSKDIYVNGTLRKKYGNEYISTLKQTFKDAPVLYNNIDKVSFSTSSLIKITEEYHNYSCPNEKCYIYKGKGRGLNIGLKPIFKYETSEIKIKESNVYIHYYDDVNYIRYENSINETYKSNLSYSYGLGINISTPSKRLRLEYSILKHTSHFEKTYNIGKHPEVSDFISDDNNKYDFRLDGVEHQILLSYMFTNWSFKPLIGFGGVFVNNTGYINDKEIYFPEASLGSIFIVGVNFNVIKRIDVEMGYYRESRKDIQKFHGSPYVKRLEVDYLQNGLYFSANFLLVVPK